MHDSAGGIAARLASTDQVLYKVPHAAKVMDFSERYMWRLVRDGEIRSIKVGSSRRISRDSLIEYAKRLTSDETEDAA